MADTAAFFASKKKKGGAKKKAFKSFNANKIDASEVVAAAIQHVDAPAVDNDLGVANIRLTGTEKELGNGVVGSTAATGSGGGDGWDDDAVAARLPQRPAVVVGATTKNLTDMSVVTAAEDSSANRGMATELSSNTAQRGNDDDIAERLKVEETRAKLAAAREGMEREAQRLQQEKEAKAAAAQQSSLPPMSQPSGIGLGGGGGGATGGKWLPPHLRGRTSMPAPPGRSGSGLGSSFQRRVDTEDENMFPDLAAADAILTQQQEQEKKAKKAVPPAAAAPPPSWGAGPGPGASNSAAEADRAFMGGSAVGGGGGMGERFGDRWRYGPAAPGLNAAGKPITMQNTSLQAATGGGGSSSPGAPVWRRGMPLPGKTPKPQEEEEEETGAPKEETPDVKEDAKDDEPVKEPEPTGEQVEHVPPKTQKDTPEDETPPAAAKASTEKEPSASEPAPEAAAPAPATGDAKKKKKKKKDLSTFKVSS